MRGWLTDFRHALRLYRRTPGASFIAIAGFALAMAAVAACVSLYVDLLLKPHAGFERGNRLVTFGWNDGTNAGGLPMDLIDLFGEEAVTLEVSAGTAPQSFVVGPDREQIVGEMVTRDFFPGVRPRLALGRGFEGTEHSEDGEPVIVIGYNFWQERFDGRRDVIGETLDFHTRTNALPTAQPNQAPAEPEEPTAFRIVGVMSERFTGTLPPSANIETNFWLPIEQALPMMQPGLPDELRATLRQSITLRGMGLRRSGASVEAVVRELNERFIDELPNLTGRSTTRYDVLKGLVFSAPVQDNTERQLNLFLGASILLALVAAANISLFLLAGALGRQRELGIRMAVGAPLKRLARQLASESVVLVAISAALGLLMSVWIADFLRGMDFLEAAQWRNVTLLDWRVMIVLAAVLLLVTLLVSLAPIFGLKRLGIIGSSRRIAARATVSQRIAGAAQIAVAGALGAAAISFGLYLGSLLFGDDAYRTQDIHALTYEAQVRVDGNNTLSNALVDSERRRERLLSLPSVSGVSIAGAVPGIQAIFGSQTVQHPENPNDQIRIEATVIDPQYVDLLELTLAHGRSPDVNEPGAMLVNQTLARRYFGRENVVGETLALGMTGSQGGQIVGVLEDFSFQHPAADAEPMVFLTQGMLSTRGLALLESPLAPAELHRQVQDLVDDGELELTIIEVMPLRAVRNQLIAADRARSFLTIGAALLVIGLVAAGFYGTQRYLVTAGRREYAIRASLGAGPTALGRLVLWRGLLLGLPGMLFGLPFAFLVVAWLRDDYVSPDISPGFVTVLVTIALVALMAIASFGPAAQARRTQPAPLLRED